MTHAQAKLQFFTDQIQAGRTVYFQTAYRVISFSPRTVSKFEKAGYTPVRVRGNSIEVVEYTRKGKPVFVCADGCRLSAR